MADAAASKAAEGNLMGVQVPSPAINYSLILKVVLFIGEGTSPPLFFRNYQLAPQGRHH